MQGLGSDGLDLGKHSIELTVLFRGIGLALPLTDATFARAMAAFRSGSYIVFGAYVTMEA